jgi:hypothetical protein
MIGFSVSTLGGELATICALSVRHAANIFYILKILTSKTIINLRKALVIGVSMVILHPGPTGNNIR